MARYDGQTEWYEGFAAGPLFAELRASVIVRLGPGPGRC